MALAVLTRKATQLDSSLHDRHIVILEESKKKLYRVRYIHIYISIYIVKSHLPKAIGLCSTNLRKN